MSPGILEGLPDLTALEGLSNLAENGLGDLVGQLEDPESLIAALQEGLGSLGELPDLQGLAAPLSGQSSQLASLIPTGLADEITSAIPQIGAVQEFIQGGALAPILEALQGGASINDLAKAGLNLFIQEFLGELPGITGGAIPADLVSAAEEFLSSAGGLGGSPSADELAAFLAGQVFGLPADSLQGLAGVEQAFTTPLATLQGQAGPGLDALEAGLAAGLEAVTGRLESIDPLQEGDWQEVQDLLNAAQAAMTSLRSAASGLPSSVFSTLSQLNLDRLQDDLSQALQGLPAALSGLPSPSFGSISGLSADFLNPLDELIARLEEISPGDIEAALQDNFTKLIAVFDLLAGIVQDNPVMAFFDDLQEILQPVTDAIGSLQETITGALQTLKDTIEGLLAEFSQIKEALDAALQSLIQTIQSLDITTLVQAVQSAFEELNELLAALPLQELQDALDSAFTTLEGLVGQLSEVAGAVVEQVDGLLTTIEELEFEPLAEPVIEAISAIRDTLAAINPDLLPGPLQDVLEETLQIFTEAFGSDPIAFFETDIVDTLEAAFDTAVGAVSQVTQTIQGKLGEFTEAVGRLDPAELLQPVVEVFEQLSAALDGLSAAKLLEPVTALLDEALQKLEELSPAELFAPLETAFEEQVLAPLQQIKPSELLQPLIDAFSELQEMINSLDFAEALGGLAETTTGFLGEVQGGLVGALDFSSLPGTGSAAADVQPVLALFNPATPMEDWTSVLADTFNSYRPSKILEPVTTALQPLESALQSLGDEALVSAFSQLQDLGGAAQTLNALPAAYRSGLEAVIVVVEANRPAQVVAGLQEGYSHLQSAFDNLEPADLPEDLRARYQAAQAAIRALDPAVVIAPLDGAYEQLAASLRQAAERPFDFEDLQAQFGAALASSVGALPGLLLASPESDPLTPATIRAGLAEFLPSSLAAQMDERFTAFLQAAETFGPTLQAQLESLLRQLGEKIAALTPAALFERFDELFSPIREALQAFSPQALADTLDELFAEVVEKLGEIHPRVIREAIQATFDAALAKLRELKDGLIEAVTQGIDAALAQLRTALQALDPATLLASLNNLFDVLKGELEELNLEELLDRLETIFEKLRDDLVGTLRKVGVAFTGMIDAIPA